MSSVIVLAQGHAAAATCRAMTIEALILLAALPVSYLGAALMAPAEAVVNGITELWQPYLGHSTWGTHESHGAFIVAM